VTSYVPPQANTEYITYIVLQKDGANVTNPTIADGDFTVSTDGSAFSNLDTLPSVTPAGGVGVKVTVSIAEMSGANVLIAWHDPGDTWDDGWFSLQTSTNQIDELALAGVPVDAVFVQTPDAIESAVQGGRLIITRDSDWIARLYIVGGISASRDDLLFTVKTPQKKDAGAADSEAIIQISEVAGLLYLNGAGGEAAEGSLTVVDEMDDDGNGVVDLVLSSWATAQLAKYSGYAWDIKEIELGADLARVTGLLDVAASVTRTIS
jgi:hypothetical protein